MITRHIQPALLDLACSFPVVTVVGPRQSGKTTLCQMAFPDKRYVSLEDLDDRRYAIDDPRGFLKQLESGAILDEVQRAPDLLSYLQGMVDRDSSAGRFVLTGSSNMALRSDVTQSLAGRTGVLELLPFSIGEREEISPVDDMWRAVWEGGYPAIHDRGIPADRWLGAYVSTYVERDVRQLVAVGNLTSFQSFIELVATQTGNLVNLSGLGGGVGVSHNTARSWLSVLEAGYLVRRLSPLHRNLRKRIIKTPKLHVVDSGLACWLLGIRAPSELERHPLIGSLLETWVVGEVAKAFANRGVRARLHYWRDHRGREVHLVVDRGRDLLAVEVKSGATIHPSFFDNLRRFEMLAREAVPPPQDGVQRLLIYGGDQRQERTAGIVIPWRQIQDYPWIAEDDA